ncbi:hemolysin family protein [Flavobacterium sp. RHBU_3]|uniref:hemolysin family protein n=1 Tax=Flavobacterium sp. RHBU_3 TaxID=3391184 RepID=UPI00398489AA
MEALIIIGCLLLSAFFSGMETAYVSANKVYLSVESRQSSVLSRVLTRLTENPIQFITAMLVGNSIALVVYGYHAGQVLMRLFQPWLTGMGVFWQTIIFVAIAAVIILFTADFLPKVFFQVYANRLIKVLAFPAYAFYMLFYGVTRLLIPVTDFILVRLMGSRGDMHKAYFTKGELGAYLHQQLTATEQQEEVDSEIEIFKNALEFTSRRAQDIMTPRAAIAGVELRSSVEGLRQLFIDTGYSKIVVYGTTVDNVLGYVHSFALFKRPATVAEVMVPIVRTNGAIYIKDLINILTRRRRSMAVVLDEYGKTLGIVTVEDVVEELFGEIEDEHDMDEPVIKQELSAGVWVFSARVEVSELNSEFGLGLPAGESYNSLGGLLVYFAGKIPLKGEAVRAAGYVFTVAEASGEKVELIEVKRQEIK